MKFGGFYNWKGGGTEIVTGGSNEGIPSSEEVLTQSPFTFFNGQFSNLSRKLVHIRFEAFRQDGSTSLHRHDIRAYESIDLRNIPLRSIGVYVETGETIGFHGMGVFTIIEDSDEMAVALTKSAIWETLHQSPDFNTNVYKNADITTAATTTLWTPATDKAIGLYKVTMSCAAAQTIELQWTDSAGANVHVIGMYRFGNEGTFVMDFDTAMLRNPNGNNGLLKAVTTTTAVTQIDSIGHEIVASQ